MSRDRRLRWTSSCYSHVGMVRKVNEDALLELAHFGSGGLWAVADGMGGHEAGDIASQIIIDALREVPHPSSITSFVTDVKAALQYANSLIQDKAARDFQSRTIGSTVVVLLAYGVLRNRGT